MDNYTIHCTPEQIKKAIELGAPIEILPNYTEYRVFPLVKCKDGNERPCIIPTAEQMIGWLEEQNIKINIEHSAFEDSLKFKIHKAEDFDYEISWGFHYPSRKEATLAAIDAALEYLEAQKK